MAGEHCADHVELCAMVRRIHDALLGNLDTNGGEGLVGKVRRHDSALKVLNRFAWLIVGAFVTAMIAVFVRGIL